MDQLPNEMLNEIFEYLDFRAIKEATLVQPLWNDLIGNNPRIMKNIAIYLFFSNPSTSEILGTLNVNRRYGCMQVNSDFTTEAIRNYAKNLTRFEICYNRSLPNDLMSLLGEMTALEDLEFYNCKLSEEKVSLINNQEPHRTLLPNLKTIQIKNTSSMILQLFTSSTVKKLYTSGTNSFDHVASLKHLEEIKLQEVRGNVKIASIRNFDFPLKKLSLSGSVDFLVVEKNCVEFAEKISSTLKHLEIDLRHKSSRTFLLSSSFSRLSNLHTLDINYKNFYIGCESCTTQPPNLAVKNLIIRGCRSYTAGDFAKIFARVPNVEVLVIRIEKCYIDNELMLVMSRYLSNLKELNIFEADERFMDNIFMPTLQKFEIKWLRFDEMASVDVLAAICIGFPNVSTLSMESFLLLERHEVKIITEGWKNLRVIFIGKYLLDHKILEFMFQTCSKLQFVYHTEPNVNDLYSSLKGNEKVCFSKMNNSIIWSEKDFPRM